jgi:hypothetical protein
LSLKKTNNNIVKLQAIQSNFLKEQLKKKTTAKQYGQKHVGETKSELFRRFYSWVLFIAQKYQHFGLLKCLLMMMMTMMMMMMMTMTTDDDNDEKKFTCF